MYFCSISQICIHSSLVWNPRHLYPGWLQQPPNLPPSSLQPVIGILCLNSLLISSSASSFPGVRSPGSLPWLLSVSKHLLIVPASFLVSNFMFQSFGRPYFDSFLCMVFPGIASGKEPARKCRGPQVHGFGPGVGKIPWRRAWQPTPVFSAGESPWTEEPGRLHKVHGVTKSQTRLKH